MFPMAYLTTFCIFSTHREREKNQHSCSQNKIKCLTETVLAKHPAVMLKFKHINENTTCRENIKIAGEA